MFKAQEYFLTQSEPLCTGLTAGNISAWIDVSQSLYYTFWLKFAGIDISLQFKFQCCPKIDGKPGESFISTFNSDGTAQIDNKNGTDFYFFSGARVGYIRINFLVANGGTPTIDGYYFGGR